MDAEASRTVTVQCLRQRQPGSQGALDCPAPVQMAWLSDGGPMGLPNAPAAGVRPGRGNKKPVTLFGSGVTDCHNTEALLDQKEVVRNCFLTKTFLNKQACARTHAHPHTCTHTHHHQVEMRCGAESCPESDGGEDSEAEDVCSLSSTSRSGHINHVIHGLGAPAETWACGDGSVHQDGVEEPPVS